MEINVNANFHYSVMIYLIWIQSSTVRYACVEATVLSQFIFPL